MYSNVELATLLGNLPVDDMDLRLYPEPSRRRPMDYDVDPYDERESGSSGTFTYIPLGGDAGDEVSDVWEGGCFACWGQLIPTALITNMTYHNPVSDCASLTADMHAFLALGWDEVIRPCFHSHLPDFNGLLRQSTINFADTRHRSLLEASFYFRLARSYTECLAFPVTASILRNRYPDTSPAVLLAMTCFGPLDESGMTGEYYPVDPNQTMPGEYNLGVCLSMMRNWLWAEEQDGWRIDLLNPSAGFVGPMTRRYHGHDYYWAGAGDYFQTNLRYAGEGSRSKHVTRVWDQMCEGWEVVDALHGIFLNAEAEAKELAISEPLDVTVNLVTVPNASATINRLNERNRMW